MLWYRLSNNSLSKVPHAACKSPLAHLYARYLLLGQSLEVSIPVLL
jgi:hypothetical protein